MKYDYNLGLALPCVGLPSKLLANALLITYLCVLQGAAEADTFFCFSELLSGFRDNFCQQLDNSVVGIRSTLTRLSQLLKEHDEELWRHLEVTTKVCRAIFFGGTFCYNWF